MRANRTTCGFTGDGGDNDGDYAAVASQCSTLRLDPETRGAMPRAGLRRHALAARLAIAVAAAFAAAVAAAAATARSVKRHRKKLLKKSRA